MGDGPSPLTDVREISRLAYGFMASKALFAALDQDLFSRLSGHEKTLSELSVDTAVAPNRLNALLAALTALGLLVRSGGSYANSPAAERYLVRGVPNYFGDYYRLQIDKQIYPSFEQLSDGLAGRPVESVLGRSQDPREAELFSTAQHQGSAGPAILLARAIDLAGCHTLLDVGGGSGAFSIAICRRYPQISSTIIDFPSVVVVGRRCVEEAGLAEQIDFVAGDALEAEWPAARDAVLMSYLVSAVGEADVDKLLDRTVAALAPGGVLIVHDFMLDADRSGPREAAMWFLVYVAQGIDGISFSAEELCERLEQRGFDKPTSQVLIPDITKVVVATRP
jgi:2-hydroxy-4-(methylsulfanyl)butanoate S-methyltransferase